MEPDLIVPFQLLALYSLPLLHQGMQESLS